MAAANSQEVLLKVPIDLRTTLVKILKHFPSGIKFNELALYIRRKFNLNLELCSSNTNEVVLEVTDEDNQTYRDTYPAQHTADDLDEFRNLLNRIDFDDDLNDTLQPQTITNFTTKYVQISASIKTPIGFAADRSTKMCDMNFFDRCTWNVDDVHPIFMGHIYDPSKFWVSFNRVDVFQKQLWRFYYDNCDKLKMDLSDIKVGLHCVVVISKVYYRGRIVRTDIQDATSFRVFLYDFGMVSKINVSQLYRLDESYEKYPALAVRATLTGLSSLDEQMWTTDGVVRFTELTANKNLIAEIVNVHKQRKILEINLYDRDFLKVDKVLSINYRLVHEGLAKVAWHHIPEDAQDTLLTSNNPYKAKRQFMYLLPPFEMIECGVTPSTVHLIEELKKCVPWDVLFPDFYEYVKKETYISMT